MKKIFLLIFIFSFSFLLSYSQTPNWEWARSAKSGGGAAGFGEGINVTTDHFENVFAVGSYHDTITFGSHVLSGASSGVYLVKYDSSGNVIWAKSDISAHGALGYGVCTDGFGNCFLSGHFLDAISFGSFTLTGALNIWDVFLVKYDSSGNVLWARSGAGTGGGANYCYNVTADIHGNVFVTGSFGPSITFGSQTLTAAGGGDIFIVKYDPSGNVLWARSAGGTGLEEGDGLATDASGNVYMTGEFASSAISFGSYNFTNASGYDMFLVKYDSSGNVLWAKTSGGIGTIQGYSVATDASQNVYVTGQFTPASISFGSYTITNSGGSDAFFVKYDSSGTVLWAKDIGGTGNEKGYSVAADNYGKIYLTGSFGTASTSITIDTITLQRPAVFNDPMFVAGFNAAGHALFAKALSSGGDDENGLATSPSGSVYITGDFMINPFVVGKDSLPLIGMENTFVAKLSYPQIAETIPPVSDNNDFILYPNPATDELVISSSSILSGTIAVYDVLGEKMLEEKVNAGGLMILNLKKLASGVYFLTVNNGETIFVRRFVKE